MIPISILSIFSLHILDEYEFPRDVHCSDLGLTDGLFSILNNCDFKLLDRDWNAWTGDFPSQDELADPSSLLSNMLGESEDTGVNDVPRNKDLFAQEVLANRITIPTNFNPSAKTNTKALYPQPGPNRDHWTTAQRQHARNAHQPANVKDLANHIGDSGYLKLRNKFYTKFGIKKNRNTYVRVNPDIFAGKDMCFEVQDQSILFLILGEMLAELRDPLEQSIEMCLGGTSSKPVLQEISTPDDMAEFITIHFQWYARMCQKGTDTPKQVHPWFLKREGIKITNHKQMVPYESRKMLDHYEEYNALCLALEGLKVHLGDIYEEIACYAEAIPGCVPSPSYPFSGFIINLNIASKVHRDGKDLAGCLVIPVGRFRGGELCLHEPGLVITHFNLPYVGTCASIILHSDREGMQWVDEGMGWGRNLYFNNLWTMA
ncbi:hypothetical protein V8D89_005956 [Ganoderma adspersum]